MNRNILHTALLLSAVLLWTACTADDLPATPQGKTGKVYVAYSASTAQTRATTEAGLNNRWNENLVDRLDLFVIREGNVSLHRAFDEVNYTDPQDNSYQPLATDLTIEDIAGCDAVYLVANCEGIVSATTLQELQDATVNGLAYNQRQTSFVMDAKVSSPQQDTDGNITLKFDLVRAAAKIRITIQPQGPNNGINTQEIKYKVNNFATSVHVLARTSSEEYNNTRTSSQELEKVTSGQVQTSNGGYTSHIVFYSYPQDWFDEAKVRQDGNGNYTIDGLHTEAPIVAERQAYILLYAPCKTGTTPIYGYYKVPLNNLLPDSNDQETFNEQEYNAIRSLYRLERNHLYDITVTIDAPGGPVEDPVTPGYTIRINDWTEGGNYQLPPDAFQ